MNKNDKCDRPKRYLSFTNNLMFRLVMDNKELCKTLIEIILGIKINELTYMNAELSIEEAIKAHGVRLDLYAEDDEGVAYDIEMQVADRGKAYLGKRTRYYQSLMDSAALKKNDNYKSLRKSVIIFICPFDPFGKNLGKYTFVNICREDKNTELFDGITKIFLNTTGSQEGLSKDLCLLMNFINDGIPGDDFTDKLNERVNKLNNDERLGGLPMTWEQDVRDRIEEAREEGVLQSLCDLFKEGIISLSIAAKKAGMSEEEFKKLAYT